PQERRPRNRQGAFRSPPEQRSRRKEAYLWPGQHPENRSPVLLFQPEQPLWVLQRNQNRHPQRRTRFLRLRPQTAERRSPPVIHPTRLLPPQHSAPQPVNPQTIPL